MVIHKVINKLFSTPSSISILRELSKRNIGVTGREIARLAGVTPQSAHNALSSLESLKIVKREFVGRSHYFLLNRTHFLYKHIVKLIFESESEFKRNLYNKIKKDLSKLTESVLLFGSVAREEERSESDMDICIIYIDGKEKIEVVVSRLRNNLYDEFGVTLAPYYITLAEFKKRVKQNKPPVNNILKESKLISGKTIQRFLND